MTTRTQHKNFAVNVLGISESIYDSINKKNEERNALIRKERGAHMQKCMDWAAGLCEHPGEFFFGCEK